MSEDVTRDLPPDQGPANDEPTLASTPADALGDLHLPGDDDEWPTRGPAGGVRLAFPIAGLLAVLLVAAGFWGGAAVQKSHGSSSSTSSSFASLASRFTRAVGATGARGATGASGFNFGGGASGGTSGTISIITGDTLYVLTSTGALVKVAIGPSTTITRNATTKAIGLRPGDTVTVVGPTGASGAISATSVAATAPGVTSSGRGFGGGAGGFSGSGGSTTGAGSGG